VFGIPGILCSAGQQKRDSEVPPPAASTPHSKRGRDAAGQESAHKRALLAKSVRPDDDEEDEVPVVEGVRLAQRLADGSALRVCGRSDMDVAQVSAEQPIRIFGPEGIAALVVSSLQLTFSFVRRPIEIVELVGSDRGMPIAWSALSAPAALTDPTDRVRVERAAAEEAALAAVMRGAKGPGASGKGRIQRPGTVLATDLALAASLGVAPECLPDAASETSSAWGSATHVPISARANPVCQLLSVRRLLPDSDGLWRAFADHNATAVAAPIEHAVPSLAWVFSEPDRPGRLCIEKIRPVLKRNRDALQARGITVPERLLGDVKAGKAVTMPDGTLLDPSDPNVVEPKVRGRKLAFLGDTCAPSVVALRECMGADLLVHEATNAITEEDRAPTDPAQVASLYAKIRAKTVSHGHSTPQMAGAFARAAAAKTLVITHFSARYRGGSKPHHVEKMLVLAEQARRMLDGCPKQAAEACLIPAPPSSSSSSSSSSSMAAAATKEAKMPSSSALVIEPAAARDLAVAGNVLAAFDALTLRLGFKRNDQGHVSMAASKDVGIFLDDEDECVEP
jgi:ribonuclease BN (tRNA processing enzyme)